jgi:hypothetical protein
MKFFIELPRHAVERILRTPSTVSYEQKITSNEGDYFVDQKVYKVLKVPRPCYTIILDGREVRVDPSTETKTLCWQIPVPHETTAESVRRYVVSDTTTFVLCPSECYFQASDESAISEISSWTQRFL